MKPKYPLEIFFWLSGKKGNMIPVCQFSHEFQRNAMAARVNYLTVDGTNLPYTPLYPLHLFIGSLH